jgi:dTDP-4-amino-4,6-dideoxygalactose transaminase
LTDTDARADARALSTATRRVRYVDFPAQFAAERSELMAIVEGVFARGDFVGGAEIERLEADLAADLQIAHVVACNSGTDALILALAALGIGPGDEVITAANSFVASAAAIVRVGGTPVFADVGDDQLLDPDAVEAAITPRTRALMPVHLTGRVCNMARLLEIARKRGLAIVEDAAQAYRSQLDGRYAGTFGTINAFSAHPLKNLGAAGDAGFVTTSDAALAARVRRARNHGFVDRETALEWGTVSRLDTLQAAVLRFRLRGVAATIATRRANAGRYHELLDRERTWFPLEGPGHIGSYHLFVIQTDRRDELRRALERRGVATKIHYPTPIHLLPAAAALGYAPGSLPVTERQAERILSLPIHQFLEAGDLGYVAREIDAFFR